MCVQQFPECTRQASHKEEKLRGCRRAVRPGFTMKRDSGFSCRCGEAPLKNESWIEFATQVILTSGVNLLLGQLLTGTQEIHPGLNGQAGIAAQRFSLFLRVNLHVDHVFPLIVSGAA